MLGLGVSNECDGRVGASAIHLRRGGRERIAAAFRAGLLEVS